MDETTQQQTRAIASGDTEAFARFYRQWFDFAYSQARRATGRDEQFCLDVVQEAMMRVIRSIKPIDSEPELARWLTLVVQSCGYDELRRERRRRARERTAVAASTGESIDSLDERIEWLRRELALMNSEQSQLLTMRFGLGRAAATLKRIGAALGLKTGAVDGRLSRAVASLRQKAAEDFHD